MYPVSTGTATQAKHSTTTSDHEKTDVEYITGYLKPEDIPILSGRESNYKNASNFLENEVRWLVFKVKYRAANYYKNTKINSIGNSRNDIMVFNKESVESSKESIVNKEASIFSRFGFNWPYDYFSIAELIKIESKVDFYATNVGQLETPQASETIQTQTYAMTEAQAESNVDTTSTVQQYEVVSAPASGGGTSEEKLKLPEVILSDLMVTRETLKAASDSVPSPANQLVASEALISQGTESLYVNGVLQSFGASEDYTISGNIITLTYDLESGDSAYITYAKE